MNETFVMTLLHQPWFPWVYALVTTHLTVGAVTLYLHRCMAHGGVEFHPLIAWTMRFWLWLTTGIVTKEWVAVHRKHHAYVEREGDPHSPQEHGILRLLFLGVWYYRKEAKKKDTLEKFGKGTPDDWWERHIFSPLSTFGPVLLLGINLGLFQWKTALLIWVIQITWIPFWAAGIINGVGHYFGYRNHDTRDASHNISPIGIIMGGEELHNNHHYDPKCPRLSYKWWEFDIGWLYIHILKMFRLARVLYMGRDLQVLGFRARKKLAELKERTQQIASDMIEEWNKPQQLVHDERSG